MNPKKQSITEILVSLEEKGYEDVLVLDSEQFSSALTKRRKEIIETIRNSQPLTVSELATKVGREKSAVSRDLGDLYEYNIIELERRGRKKYPKLKHDVILAKPIFLNDSESTTHKFSSSHLNTGSGKHTSNLYSGVENAIENIDSHEAATETLLKIAESNPQIIAESASELEKKLSENPQILDSVTKIVEKMSTSDPNSVPKSLLLSLLNSGMGTDIGQNVSVDEEGGDL